MTTRKKKEDFTSLLGGYASEGGPAEAPPPAPAGDDSAPERKVDKVALYSEYLQEEGYRFKVDDDGDLSIRIQGHWFCLFAKDPDPNYFRLMVPNVWDCEDDDEKSRAVSVANELNRRFKVAKATVYERRAWVGVEMFFEPLSAFRGTFERSVDLLAEVAAEFSREMRQRAEVAAEADGARSEA